MNTPPPFEYPAADAREFFVPCEKDDPKREEFWCQCGLYEHDPCDPSWVIGEFFDKRKLKHEPDCGQHWRKKVAVPDWWQVVSLSMSGCEPGHMGFDLISGKWISDTTAQKEWNFFCFIRRIPATVQPAPKVDQPPLSRRVQIDGLDLRLTRREWDELEIVIGAVARDGVTSVQLVRGDGGFIQAVTVMGGAD